MIDTHEFKKRDLYLNKILAFQDTAPVKVVTDIRRLMTLHLKENGITDDQILEMNFEYTDKIYIQVTESMTSEDVRKRELFPLQKINDNYEKIVLSLNPGMDSSYDGIKSKNLIDWLISE
jgi:hypothetical protein